MKGARVALIAAMVLLGDHQAWGVALGAALGDTTAVTTRRFHAIGSPALRVRDGEVAPRLYAQGQSHHAHSNGSHEGTGAAQSQPCGQYFNAASLPYFRDYYSQDNYANLPPGLRKQLHKSGHLPPGLEKKYAQTGQLPPGLEKRFECGQTLPTDYSSYLYRVPDVAYEGVGPLPPDSTLYLYGRDLILLNDHTKAIIDILRGVY